MSTKSRLSWRLGPRPVPLDDYRIMLREMLDAIPPVAEWDPRTGLVGIDALAEAEQRLALDRWFSDIEQRLTCLRLWVDRMSRIHPPDGALMELHQAVIALGVDHVGCVGMRIDAVKLTGSNDAKARYCKQRSITYRSHLSDDSEALTHRIDHLRQHHPRLLAQLDLTMW